MKLNKYLFNTVNNKEHGCGQRSVVWLKRVQPCSHHLHVLSTVFSWRPFSSFSLSIILLPPSLPPFILPLLNQCDGCLVPLAWGLMGRGRGFAGHGGVTLSRGWLCQRWKPLHIPGTHLHEATQLLKGNFLLLRSCIVESLFTLCILLKFVLPKSVTEISLTHFSINVLNAYKVFKLSS